MQSDNVEFGNSGPTGLTTRGRRGLAKVFSTGGAARICKVASRTVSKWFDAGRLRGYRIPGSADRRIPREELIRFMKEHGIPLGELEGEGGPPRVVLVGCAPVLAEAILVELPGWEGTTCASPFDAGIELALRQPDAVVIDHHLGRDVALYIAAWCRALRPETFVVHVAGEDDAAPPLWSVKRPCAAAAVAQLVLSLFHAQAERFAGEAAS